VPASHRDAGRNLIDGLHSRSPQTCRRTSEGEPTIENERLSNRVRSIRGQPDFLADVIRVSFIPTAADPPGKSAQCRRPGSSPSAGRHRAAPGSRSRVSGATASSVSATPGTSSSVTVGSARVPHSEAECRATGASMRSEPHANGQANSSNASMPTPLPLHPKMRSGWRGGLARQARRCAGTRRCSTRGPASGAMAPLRRIPIDEAELPRRRGAIAPDAGPRVEHRRVPAHRRA